MAKRKGPKMPKTLWDKVKDVDETFATEIYSYTDEQLKDRLVTFANEQDKIETAKADDQDLKRLTEEKKTASESYDVPNKGIKLKRKLVLQTLKERGKLD